MKIYIVHMTKKIGKEKKEKKKKRKSGSDKPQMKARVSLTR